MKKVRYLEIDLLRGLAILGMVVYHFAFLMVFYGEAEIDLFSGFWLVLARAVQFSFLGLVGVSLAVSWGRKPFGFFVRQVARAFKIFVMAMMVTGVTYLVLGDQFVRFGILHLIALSVLVLTFFVRSRASLLVLVMASVLMSHYLQGFVTDSWFWFAIGMEPAIFMGTVDHFSFFPWFIVPCVGALLGRFLYDGRSEGYLSEMPGVDFWSKLSRWSLWIYMVHVPVLVFLGILTGTIDIAKVLQ